MRLGGSTIIAGTCLLVGAMAFAAVKLPPIGDRKYLLDESAAPVAIKPAEDQPRARYLKDPVQPSAAARVEVPPPVHRAPKAKPMPAARTAMLRFKRLPVSGHLTRPRVEFTRDQLPIDRADEPVTGSFFEKIFKPAEDDAF